MDWIAMILIVIICLVVGFLLWQRKTNNLLVKHRRQAINQSKSVILWHVHEKRAPFSQQFPYHPKDCVFIGKWFDYIVLDWLSLWELRQIIFVEIKTWRSQQNDNEKQIQQVINSKNVSYELIRLES